MTATTRSRPAPNTLTIAGSDPSGGAGIQADLKTFAALGTYGCAVITSLTAQNTQGVRGVLPTPAAFTAQQLAVLADDVALAAIKVGLLPDAETVAEVAAFLAARPGIPAVVDPVLVATSGDALAGDSVTASMRAHLLSVATVLTPNLPECAALLGRPVPENEAGMMAAGQELQQLGASWVLIKGGHRADGSVDDWLAGPDGEGHWLRGQRIDTQNTHGTGCTLSSAIAAFLAQGKPMSAAVSEAKSWLIKALERSQDLAVGDGTGHGPVHHAHAWW